MSDPLDLRLRTFLAPPRAPDEVFAMRVRAGIRAEQRLRAARRASWVTFATEMAAGASVIVAFLLLSRPLVPFDSGLVVPLYSPAMCGVILLGLWTLVSLRPGHRESA